MSGVYLSEIDEVISNKFNISKVVAAAWSQVLKINEGLEEGQTELVKHIAVFLK